MSQLKARCPGKVILTGEHSVLYQQPALALAVDCYSYADATLTQSNCCVSLPDLALTETFSQIDALQQSIEHTYQDFLAGKQNLPICSPAQLVALAAGQNSNIQVTSKLPLGSGMGSSASVIGATLKAMEPNSDNQALVQRAQQLENYQHGRSSGLDVRTCLLGGLQSLHSEAPVNPVIPAMHILFTGQPAASTGEVVEHVRHHAHDAIWQDFGGVSHAITESLAQRFDEQQFFAAIKENHRLLRQIGVVPEAVTSLINRIERQGGCAKIAGAGSHKGDAGGIVIAWGLTRVPDGVRHITANPDFSGATQL